MERIVILKEGGWILLGWVSVSVDVLQIYIHTQILCYKRFFRVTNM